MSGGAGYVISRKGLDMYGKIGHDEKKCIFDEDSHEDREMGQCFRTIGKTLVLIIT